MTQRPPRPPLEYRSPPGGEDEPIVRPPPIGFFAGMVIGFALYLGGVALVVGLVVSTFPPLSVTVLASLVLLAAMVAFSIYANARWRWRGVFAGVLLGLGLTLLIPGICIAAFWRLKI